MRDHEQDQRDLRYLVRGSPFEEFLNVDPRGLQLPSWIAVTRGLRKAMDLWVPRDLVPVFEAVARKAGLFYYLDCYFDRSCEELLSRVPYQWFTTTRAALSQVPGESAEAHFFVSYSQTLLQDAVAAGWYPLLVDGLFIEKHLADHYFFGCALGYPPCCNSFFQRRNNWQTDNHYYTIYRSVKKRPCWLINTLPRHTAFVLAPHIPCSFSCATTASYSAQLFDLIMKEAPLYAKEICRVLRKPMLCLSELRIYAFEGEVQMNRLSYGKVEPINPTRHDDDVYSLLQAGDECVVEANIIRILRGGRSVATYFARADKYGPEFPFLIQCE